MNIARTAHDLQRLGGTNIDLANIQTVGIGMFFQRQHFCHHHLVEGRRDRFQRLHLQAGHGQGMGELVAVEQSGLTKVRNQFSENFMSSLLVKLLQKSSDRSQRTAVKSFTP